MVQRGRVLENRGRGEKDEKGVFRKKYKELEVLAIENHRLCFDIT
jgi:hypothetical protein